MAQDIRKMMKDHKPESPKLSSGHEARFAEKLKMEFSENSSEERKPLIYWLKIAAIAIAFIAVSVFGYMSLSEKSQNNLVENEVVPEATEDEMKQIRLGDISPDLKKVEDFYLTGINVQLASLEITQDNKDLIEGYMNKLKELDKEYSRLNTELNQVGPTEATVTALIDNLKFRLELLFKLKNKLKELKTQNNEQYSSNLS